MADPPSRVMSAEQVKRSKIHAAMMEELGFARKDTLPLENKKGYQHHVDHHKLAAGIKQNPRASSWKNVTFDDVDPAELALDSMNNGQSHRERMKANLVATSNTYPGRGRYVTRGGGGISRAGHVASGGSRRVQHSPARYLSPEDAFSHLVPSSRGSSRPAVRGAFQGGSGRGLSRPYGPVATRSRPRSQNAPNSTPFACVPKPRPNLSFNDKRSVNDLPFTDNISTNGFSKSPGAKTTTHLSNLRPARVFPHFSGLADPEEFMRAAKKHQAQNKPSPAKPESAFKQTRALPESLTPAVANVNKDGESKLLHSYECKVEKKPHLKAHLESPIRGQARVIEFKSGNEITVLLELVDESGNVICKKSLGANFKHESGSDTVSFDSPEPQDPVKWTLRFPQPWKASLFSKTMANCEPRLPSSSLLTGGGDKRIQDRLPVLGNHETLISFSEDDFKVSTINQSTYLQDMEELTNYVDDALGPLETSIETDGKAPFLDQVSAMVASSKISREDIKCSLNEIAGLQFCENSGIDSVLSSMENAAMTDLRKFRAYGGGLGDSRYAAANQLVERRLNSAVTFQNLPSKEAEAYTRNISRKMLDRADQQAKLIAPLPVSGTSTTLTTQDLVVTAVKATQVTPQQPSYSDTLKHGVEDLERNILANGEERVLSAMKLPVSVVSINATSRISAVFGGEPPQARQENTTPRPFIKYTVDQLTQIRPKACSNIEDNLPFRNWLSLAAPSPPSMKTFSRVQATVRNSTNVVCSDNQRHQIKIHGSSVLISSKTADTYSAEHEMKRDTTADTVFSTTSTGFSEVQSSCNSPIDRSVGSRSDDKPGSSRIKSAKGLAVGSASEHVLGVKGSNAFKNDLDKDSVMIKPFRGLANSRYATPAASISQSQGASNTQNRVISVREPVSHSPTRDAKTISNNSMSIQALNAKGDRGTESLPAKTTVTLSGQQSTTVRTRTALSRDAKRIATTSAAAAKSNAVVPARGMKELASPRVTSPSDANAGKFPLDFAGLSNVLDAHKALSQTTSLLKRRDSVSSQVSRDSAITLKAHQYGKIPAFRAVADEPPYYAYSRHRSHLSKDSSSSNTSFATAAEGLESDDEIELPFLTAADTPQVEAIQTDLARMSIQPPDSLESDTSKQPGAVSRMHTIPPRSLPPTTASIQPSMPVPGGNPPMNTWEFSSIPATPIGLNSTSMRSPEVGQPNSLIFNPVPDPATLKALDFEPLEILATTQQNQLRKSGMVLKASRCADEVANNVLGHVAQPLVGSSELDFRNFTFSPSLPLIYPQATIENAMPCNPLSKASARLSFPLVQTVPIPDESRQGLFKEITECLEASHNSPYNPQLSAPGLPALLDTVADSHHTISPFSPLSSPDYLTQPLGGSFTTVNKATHFRHMSGGLPVSRSGTPSSLLTDTDPKEQQHIRQGLQGSFVIPRTGGH